MKEKWHKRIIIASIFVGLIAFGGGYALGSMNTANFVINHFYQYLDMTNQTIGISQTDIYSYFWKAVSLLK